MATISGARLALVVRLSRFVEVRHDLLGGQRGGKQSLLDEIVTMTNDLGPLFAAYEAAVLAECRRDVRAEIWREVGTFADRRAHHAVGDQVGAYQDVFTFAMDQLGKR